MVWPASKALLGASRLGNCRSQGDQAAHGPWALTGHSGKRCENHADRRPNRAPHVFPAQDLARKKRVRGPEDRALACAVRRRPEQRPRPQRSAEALRRSGQTSSTSMPANSPTTLHAIAHACVPASPWPNSLRAISQARAGLGVLVDSRGVLGRVAALGPPDGAGDDLAGRRHEHPHDDARPVMRRERRGVGGLGIADVPAGNARSTAPVRGAVCFHDDPSLVLVQWRA